MPPCERLGMQAYTALRLAAGNQTWVCNAHGALVKLCVHPPLWSGVIAVPIVDRLLLLSAPSICHLPPGILIHFTIHQAL